MGIFDANQGPVDQNTAYLDAFPMTVGATYAPLRGFGVLATVAGTVTVLFAGGTTLPVPVSAGWQTFAFSVQSVVSTTATANYYNLR